jgi:hypothetical protein
MKYDVIDNYSTRHLNAGWLAGRTMTVILYAGTGDTALESPPLAATFPSESRARRRRRLQLEAADNPD